MSMSSLIINTALITNGIYDITCAASILWLDPSFILARLHPNMFSNPKHSEDLVIKRLLSYWLITYGMVRTTAGLRRDNELDIAAAMTYFIEAFCFEYESRVGKTMNTSNVAFVYIVSTIMGILFLLRPFGVYD